MTRSAYLAALFITLENGHFCGSFQSWISSPFTRQLITPVAMTRYNLLGTGASG